LRTHPEARALRPSLGLPLRLLLAVGAAAATANEPAVFVVACGVGMLLVHRNLIAHLIALLVLGTGITLWGAVIAPALPESIELGATFDAVVGTFIGLALIRAVAAHHPLLDVESLRSLRG
jgi:hydrogenase-4 membrane subunit HyfE